MGHIYYVLLIYPEGVSAVGCRSNVNSPSLLNAVPAAENISPTCKKNHFELHLTDQKADSMLRFYK